MATGSMENGGGLASGRGTDEPEDSVHTGGVSGRHDDPAGGINGLGNPNRTGADGFSWDSLSSAELEQLVAGLPLVEVQPWGKRAVAVALREGARVTELRAALGFLPAEAVLADVCGDAAFCVVFEVPDGSKR